MIVTLENYQQILPKKKWGMYIQYVNAPTWTGVNGEMNYDKEQEQLSPITDIQAELLNIKMNICQSFELNEY